MSRSVRMTSALRTNHPYFHQMERSSVAFGTADLARLAAWLWLGCGALVILASFAIPHGHGSHRLGVFAVGVVAIAIGVGVWHAPWERWNRNATLVLVPAAC